MTDGWMVGRIQIGGIRIGILGTESGNFAAMYTRVRRLVLVAYASVTCTRRVWGGAGSFRGVSGFVIVRVPGSLTHFLFFSFLPTYLP